MKKYFLAKISFPKVAWPNLCNNSQRAESYGNQFKCK